VRTHHLKALIRFVEKGGVLGDHDDVPNGVREQLHAEENQRLEKKKGSNNSTIRSLCPPIRINNFLPAGSCQELMPAPSADEAPHTQPSRTEPITIHGLLDVAVEEYAERQQSRVSNETFRDNIKKARDVTRKLPGSDADFRGSRLRFLR
jgi:hypothetical protein